MFDGVSLGDWGQIAVGIAALIAAIFYSKRQIDKRRLAHQIKMTPIIQIDGVSSDDIEIKFKGLPVKTLSLCSISVLNLGNRPILRNDWDENLKISFCADVRIVDIRIGASIPKDLNPLFAIEDKDGLNDIQFQPFLLNSGEGFRAEIVVTGDESPKISARVIGVSKIEHLDIKKRNLKRLIMVFLFMTFISVAFAVLEKVVGTNLFQENLFISTIVGFLVVFFYRRFPTPINLDEDFVNRSE